MDLRGGGPVRRVWAGLIAECEAGGKLPKVPLARGGPVGTNRMKTGKR